VGGRGGGRVAYDWPRVMEGNKSGHFMEGSRRDRPGEGAENQTNKINVQREKCDEKRAASY